MSYTSVYHETCIGIRDDSESNTRSFLSPVNICNTNILLNDICYSTAVLDMCCNSAVEKVITKITTTNGNGSRPASRDDRGTLWGGLTFSRSAEPKPGSGPRSSLRSLTCRDSSCIQVQINSKTTWQTRHTQKHEYSSKYLRCRNH